jgi:hypothetical protein
MISSAAASASKYRWRKSTITLSVSTSLTSNVANIAASADVPATIDRSINAWQDAGSVTIRRVSTTEQSVSPAGNQGDGISLLTIAATPENVALFPQGLDDATARTRVFYDARGSITEADIVLNPYLQFSTDGTPGTFDLESTLTHEIGHLLGLTHSPVVGATMNDNYGRNGVYNLPAFSARTLSSDDVVSIRSLYGPADADDDCCGRLNGKITLSNGKAAAGYVVWAEDSQDGHVIAAATVGGDGSLRMGGLPIGRFKLFAQNNDPDSPSAASDLGEVTVSSKQPATFIKRLDKSVIDSHIDYLGFNGQLAEMAVPVNSGNSYSLLAGSSSLGDNNVIEATSPLVSVETGSFAVNFSNHIRTVAIGVSVAPNAPTGEYSIALRTASGDRRFIIGGLTVEKFPNFWSTSLFK